MLTKQQYIEKHKVKFSSLTQKEKDKRYRDYQLSKAMRKGTGPVVVKAKGAKPNQLSYATMSQCSKLYATALLDPWNVQGNPCIPDNITLPSYKFAARSRGNFIIGEGGLGWVAVNPYAFVTNTNNSVIYTNNLYTETDYDPSATGVTTSLSDSNLPQASFVANYLMRVVGFGIRARYVGAEMSRSGQVISYRQATNSAIPEPSNPSALLQNRETSTIPADRKWHECLWKPSAPTDLAYSITALNESAYSQSIMVVGGDPGTSFEYDIMGWYEVVGSQLPFLTRSHSDPIGLSVVNSALSTHQPTNSNSFADFVRSATEIANESISFIGAMKPVFSAVSSFL